jgi:hypothetical protein
MPVSEQGIGCAYRGGDYWQAGGDDPELWDDIDREPDQNVQRSVIRHPDPVTTGATLETTQDRGNSGGNDPGSLYNERDARAAQTGSARSGAEPPGGTRRRRTRSGKLGQEQSVSYQAEERYWTDYLRIALPIAGLLLLLGVFWYWASTFIGDDADDDPQTPVAQIVETPITANTPTPTLSAAINLTPVTVEPTQETQSTEPTQETEAEPTATTAEETTDPGTDTDTDTGTEGQFVEGDFVVVNDNDVNLRTDATTESESLGTLILGEQLTILSSESVDDGTYIWWNVEDLDGNQGWVAGQFLDPSE